MGLPVNALEEGLPSLEDPGGSRVLAFSSAVNLVGRPTVAGVDSVVVLDAGATANLGCCKWLERHNSILESRRGPRADPYPARGRFKFGGCRLGEARFSVDIPGFLGVVGN